ncbi:WhiB family transcriptional regulator [Nonomuraea sp. NPDC026600]|uniref:WhiB family transcriptional regulator n=1 Tax=Nonomuraea sp. NPDC026600 TaxID=3155363 RepID=UPI0033CE1CE1
MTELPVEQRRNWWHFSACDDEDADLFYADTDLTDDGDGGVFLLAGEDLAKAICANCPVREECLRWALHHKEHWGVWGGLNPRERRDLTRRKGYGLAWAS